MKLTPTSFFIRALYYWFNGDEQQAEGIIEFANYLVAANNSIQIEYYA